MIISYQAIFTVGLGGFLGSITRVLLNSYITKLINSHFPFGILVVNILGSFLIGVAIAIFLQFNINENIKSFVIAGFLGGFTTFSTFSLDSFFLLQNSFLLGLTNILLNLIGTIIAVAVGYKFTSYIIFFTRI